MAIDIDNLLTECFADTALIEILGFRNPYHVHGNSEVFVNRKHPKYKNRTFIGVIDDDKRKDKDFEKFEEIESEGKTKLFKHPDCRHYIILISPAFEGWIDDIADRLGIERPKYKLQAKLDGFKKECKKPNARENPNLRNYLNAIRQKKPAEMEQVRKWIEKLLP